YTVVSEAVAYCRQHRAPVFLHLRTVRLLGHAGSDIETEYHTLEEIAAIEEYDPLLYSAQTALEAGLVTAPQLLELYESIRRRVRAVAEEAVRRPKQSSIEQITAPLAPYHADAVNVEAKRPAPAAARIEAFGGASELPEAQRPRHMKVLINQALHDA